MIFLSPQKAMDYLQEKVKEFYVQSDVLKEQLLQVGRIRKVTTDQGVYLKTEKLKSEIMDSLNKQLDLENKLRPFIEYFRLSPRLGAVPLVLLAVAIPFAGALAAHLAKISKQKQELELIAKGLLSPEQLTALRASEPSTFGFGFGAGIGIPLIVLALAGVFYLKK